MTTDKEIIAVEKEFLAGNYKPLPVVLERGEGVWLWDTQGKKYLDFLSAYSAVSFGHLNPRIKKAMLDQLELLDVPARAYHTTGLGSFAKMLCAMTGMDKMLPMNTGAEAVETAIKAARRWGVDVKNIPDGNPRIIVSSNNFHGRTTTIVGFSSDEDYKRGFGPFDNAFDIVPFGDIQALADAITPDTCAFMTEPIQGEGGIIMPPDGFLRDAQALCREKNILFMLDEIQTGMGRTGRNFCYEHELDTPPDCLMLGKALGGGVYPVSAFLARKDVMDVFDYGSHGSTFGGNPIAAAIGMEALSILKEDDLAKRSDELGAHMMKKLKGLNSPMIDEVRGKGLLIGVEINPAKATARAVCEKLMDKGILSKETHETVVRFAPPLIIEKDNLDWAIEMVAETLSEMN